MTAAPLILIVGMHRSGTSLLGNLLHAAGVALPGPLIAGDQHNPEGYFERADITDLQEQLLIDLERWWPSAMGTQPLPVDWLCRPATHATLNQLLTVLQQEAARQEGPWAIKDPRSSLLLPLWRRLAGELQIPLRLILAVRHPAEVVQSLCQRDVRATGMDAHRGERLWWHHNQTVLRHAAGLPLMVVDYSQWFSPGDGPMRQLKQLWSFCGLTPDTQQTDKLLHGLAQIKPEHRRSSAAAPGVLLHRTTEALYRHLVAGALGHAVNAIPPSSPPSNQSKRWWRRCIGPSQHPDRQGWFDPHFYRRRYPDLTNLSDPLGHFQLHGWREGRQPHPLFEPGHYLRQCLQHGLVLPADQSPLDHFLARGRPLGLTPTPLALPAWWDQWRTTQSGDGLPQLSDLHPWGGAALALADQDLAAAASLLSHWQTCGFPAADWRSISQAPNPWLRWASNPPVAVGQSACKALQLSSWGMPPDHWLSQGWLASLPDAEPPPSQRSIHHLHLVLLPPGELEQEQKAELQALSHNPGLAMIDPNPQRCLIWQRLGLAWVLWEPPTAALLDQHFPADPWLERAQTLLGLPHPATLTERPLVTLGSGGALWDAQCDHPKRWCFPGFDALLLNQPHASQSLAAWLWHGHRQGLQLVRLSGNSQVQASQQPLSWLPMEWICVDGLSPEALDWELRWRAEGRPDPPAPTTPQPVATVLWDGGHGRNAAAVAVVVSLFNYAKRIESALASVASQQLAALELIVVDDASTDDGATSVQRWLQQHGQRFCRARLLQHTHNAGLAAARNTAFAATEAPWCLVLDADNALLPDAASALLAMTQHSSTQLAVVHPLIAQQVEEANGSCHTSGLLTAQSWQRAVFAQRSEGNYIDAMALVRRSAWEAVGGYVHILGGWEDFDFWCLLIEAGYHGVVCPAVVAEYRSHSESMLHLQTHSNVRRISRLLQHRHPWLHLRLGQADF